MSVFLSYLNKIIFFRCVSKSKFLFSEDSWIFLAVGKYQSRAPTSYLSIYLDYTPIFFG